MIREANMMDVMPCAAIAERYFSQRKAIGRFSGQLFVEFWGKVLDSGIGRIFVRQSGGTISEAIGLVIIPSPFTGHISASSMFWYVTDTPSGLAAGALFSHVMRTLGELNVTEFRIPINPQDQGRVGAFLKESGFEVCDVTYMKEDLC